MQLKNNLIMKQKYIGDIYVIDGKKLSKYTHSKLQLTNGWGFVKVVKNMSFNKVKVNVYYLDFGFIYKPINYISTEIVDKDDVCLLNWSMIMYMYNTQDTFYIIKDYFEYLELYCVTSFNDDNKSYIYHYGHRHEDEYVVKVFDGNEWSTQYLNIQNWMIEQVELNKINIDKHISKLKSKYHIK